MSKFKIMKGSYPCSVSTVPLEYAKKFEAQALRNHSQTIDRLNERGGLDPVEFYAVAHGVCWSEAKRHPQECIEWLEKEFGLLKQLSQAQEKIKELKESNQKRISEHDETKKRMHERIVELEGKFEQEEECWLISMNARDERIAELEGKLESAEADARDSKESLEVAVEALRKYSNPAHPCWISHSREVNGSLVHYIKNIQELSFLASDALASIAPTEEDKGEG